MAESIDQYRERMKRLVEESKVKRQYQSVEPKNSNSKKIVDLFSKDKSHEPKIH